MTKGILLFKGGAKNPLVESQLYYSTLAVHFNSTGSVNEEFVLNVMLPFWIALEGAHQRIRILFLDHHKSHYTERVKRAFEQARTILVMIPKSLTWLLQALDVFFFFAHFRREYETVLAKAIRGGLSGVTTAGEKRVYTQRFSSIAACNMFKKYWGPSRFLELFGRLGYIGSPLSPQLRAMSEYRYDALWVPESDTGTKAIEQIERVKLNAMASKIPQQVSDCPQTDVLPPPLLLKKAPAPKKVGRPSKISQCAQVKGQTTLLQFCKPQAETRRVENDNEEPDDLTLCAKLALISGNQHSVYVNGRDPYNDHPHDGEKPTQIEEEFLNVENFRAALLSTLDSREHARSEHNNIETE